MAIHREAAHWSNLFALPPVEEVLPAICHLIRPPFGGPEVAQVFGPQLMAAVGRAILSGDALQQELGMPLLIELCTALRPEGSASQPSRLPVILTAQQHGVQLAAYINKVVNSWPNLPQPSPVPSTGSGNTADRRQVTDAPESQACCHRVAAAWVAVLCLPHANSDPGQIAKLLKQLIAAAASVLEGSAAKPDKLQDSSKQAGSSHAEVLFLQCYARGVLALVLQSHAAEHLTQHLEDTLHLLSQHPQDFQVVKCAAEVASIVTKGGKKLAVQQLQVQAASTHQFLLFIALTFETVQQHLLRAPCLSRLMSMWLMCHKHTPVSPMCVVSASACVC